MEEKKKELVCIGGVEFVNLSDCKVHKWNLQCDSNDTYEKEVPSSEGMDVVNGAGMCSQIVGPDLERATEPVLAPVGIHTNTLGELNTFVMDPLFNAARKVLLLDAVIINQEASWFQLWKRKDRGRLWKS